MPTLPSASSGLRVSGIREMRELSARVSDVVNLAIGEPDQNTPMVIGEAAFRAAREGFTKYTSTNGFLSLRTAIARKLAGEVRRHVDPDQVTVSSGAVSALSTTVLATVGPGGEVLLPDPGWPNYASMVRLAGATAVRYPLSATAGFLPDVDTIRKLVSPKTRLIIVNNPGNPTGAVFSSELVRGIVDLAAEHDIFVLSDEVYKDFVYDTTHSFAAAAGYEDGVVSVFSFSKAYAMTGWRLGYSLASHEIASAVSRVQGTLLSCASSISQKAGEAALALASHVPETMRDEYRRRRHTLTSLLGDRLVLVPQGAFYALVDISNLAASSYEVAKDLLVRERVASVPGEAFGSQCERVLRISFAATHDDVAEGCRRIARYLDSHGAPRRSSR